MSTGGIISMNALAVDGPGVDCADVVCAFRSPAAGRRAFDHRLTLLLHCSTPALPAGSTPSARTENSEARGTARRIASTALATFASGDAGIAFITTARTVNRISSSVTA
jgi:hypothetical protein